MINRTTFVKGYSRKAKESASPNEKSQSTEAPRLKKPARKTKLPTIPLNSIKTPTTNTHKVLFSNIAIIRPIEERSKDFEKAIKDHLGIRSLSKDSSFESNSPKSKPKTWKRTTRVPRSFDASQLTSIEKEENRISEAIKGVWKSGKKTEKVEKKRIVDEKDKEIQLVQESLNKINLLLNRILQKSPNRNK